MRKAKPSAAPVTSLADHTDKLTASAPFASARVLKKSVVIRQRRAGRNSVIPLSSSRVIGKSFAIDVPD